MKLTMSVILALYNAHLALDGRQISTFPDGKPNVEPFSLSMDFRWAVQQNLHTLQPHVEAFQVAQRAKQAELRKTIRKATDDLAKGDASEEAIGKVRSRMEVDATEQLQLEMDALLKQRVRGVKLAKLGHAAFALDVNKIPHATMMELNPVIDFTGRAEAATVEFDDSDDPTPTTEQAA